MALFVLMASFPSQYENHRGRAQKYPNILSFFAVTAAWEQNKDIGKAEVSEQLT